MTRATLVVGMAHAHADKLHEKKTDRREARCPTDSEMGQPQLTPRPWRWPLIKYWPQLFGGVEK